VIDHASAIAELDAMAKAARLRRIHVLAWRDLADVEAGGSELHAAAIAALWAEAGIDVTIRTSYAQGHPPDTRRDGYRVVRRAGRYLVFPRAVVAELAGRHGPRDALVEIWNGMPFWSPLWCRGPRVVFCHHVHGPMWSMVLPPNLARIGETVERRVAPPVYRRSTIVTLSESSRRELIDELGFRPARVRVVPPGIDRRFRPGRRKAPRALVVAVGRLMPVKRFDILIDAMVRVRARVADAELVIVGDGAEHDHLDSLIEAHDAKEWVTLAGRVGDDELVSLYRKAWVVASASAAEGWGMTITEAAACGTPAVATDIAGHRDAVRNGVSGVLAPVERLSDAIAEVLSDEGQRKRLAEGARLRAQTLTWEATALGTLEAIAVDAHRHHAD
jgi:glycosyltransferase involved in cell wall biosynthesis